MEITGISIENIEAFETIIKEEAVMELLTDPNVLGLGAVLDSMAIGAVVYRVEEGDIRILSLYVEEHYRRGRVGTGLFLKVLQNAIDVGFDGGITADFYHSEQSELLYHFLESMGFEFEELDDCRYEIALKDIEQLSSFKPRKSSSIVSISELSRAQRGEYISRMQADEEEWIADGLLEELYDPKVSKAYLNEGKVEGCLLLTKEEDSLEITGAYISEKHAIQLLGLLCNAISDAKSGYGEDVILAVNAIGRRTSALAKALFEKKAKKTEQRMMAHFDIA